MSDKVFSDPPRRMVRLEGFEASCALDPSEADAYLRRFCVLFADDSRARRGGLGSVTQVTNALGETFALKTLILPEDEGADDPAAARDAAGEPAAGGSPRVDPAPAVPSLPPTHPVPRPGSSRARKEELLRGMFRSEYECHRALSDIKGFPRLYGRGTVDGVPAIVMEWVEGETLAQARRRLALDDEGRWSPLVAARLGRDLFELLGRMGLVGDGFVHRDISPANIMIRTNRLSVEDQAEEGRFDLCLIDFGSTSAELPRDGSMDVDESFTSTYAAPRRATPAYAAPEMLSDDLPDVGRLRRSPTVDVYEAGSVLYELVAGYPPYAARSDVSPFRQKVDVPPERPVTLHAGCADVARLLVAEPEVALEVGDDARELGVEPDSAELGRALSLVDGQLVDIVLSCLEAGQRRRPAAAEVRGRLASFSANYGQNVVRALRGEPLIPCSAGDADRMADAGRVSLRALRRALTALALVAWVSVIVSALMMLAGVPARMGIGGVSWRGELGAAAIAAALALPGFAAFLARGRARGSRAGLVRASLVLAVLAGAACAAAAQVVLDPPERSDGLMAAMVACTACAWFLLVVDYVLRTPLDAGTGGGLPDGVTPPLGCGGRDDGAGSREGEAAGDGCSAAGLATAASPLGGSDAPGEEGREEARVC